MDESRLSELVNFLRKIYVFSKLEDEKILKLAADFDLVDYSPGERIFKEGDEADFFYIVKQGKVQLTHLDGDEETLWGVFGVDEYFGEEALILNHPRSATALAVGKIMLFRLSKDQFFRMLVENPVVQQNLLATIESRRFGRRLHFEWLGKEEVIYLITRKHNFFLIRSVILPVLFGILAIPVFILSIGNQSDMMTHWLLGLSSILLAGGVLWGIWNYIDWGNDYYIVTNQRVLWVERVAVLYYSRREAPLNTILAVNITSSQVGRILNYGNVDVRTFTGSIFMRNMTRPDLFASFVKGHQEIARLHTQEDESEAIERIMRRNIGLEDKPDIENVRPSPKKDDGLRRASLTKPSNLRDKIDTFFKVRYETGGVITYRKHWLILIKKTGLPWMSMAMLFSFIIFLIVHRIGAGERFIFSGWIWTILLLPLFFILFLWWGYHYLDWSNDIYRLTPDQIMDIEKKPLGKEDKKTASLDSILSIEHTRTGIIQLMFNYGNVTINVGQTKFIFKGVYNPDQVHQDVADYMETRNRKKREAEVNKERENLSKWFKTYHNQAKPRNWIENLPGIGDNIE